MKHLGAAALGATMLAIGLAACGGGGGSSSSNSGTVPTAAPSASSSVLAKAIAIADTAGDQVVVYGPSGAGYGASATIPGNATTCVNAPSGVAFDASDRLYVANEMGCNGEAIGSVAIFAAGVSGTVAATPSLIVGGLVNFVPDAVAVDAAGTVYVALGSAATFDGAAFAAGSNGGSTSATYGNTCTGPCVRGPIAASAANVAISDGTSLQLFANAMTQGLPAVASVSPAGVVGLAYDAAGALHVATNAAGGAAVQTLPSGSVTASSTLTISTSSSTLLNAIALDGRGNLYALLSQTAAGAAPVCQVSVYAPGASGSAAPSTSFANVCGHAIAATP